MRNLQEESKIAKMLCDIEVKYGGPIRVKREKVSPNDPRSQQELKRGSMTGGERMVPTGKGHNYGPYYAKTIKHFLGEPVTLVEVGILAGSGLALWCDVFPNGNIHGLDIDLGHFERNYSHLESLGAFAKNMPRVHEFDQLVSVKEQRKVLSEIFEEKAVDIVVDDGFHSDESILSTFQAFEPFMADKHVYCIEDNKKVITKLVNNFPKWQFNLYITGPRWTDALILGRRR